MNRRDALRSLALLTGGLVLVPSCDMLQEDILEAYEKLQITPSLRDLLASISDTIIPQGRLKGAADLEIQDFILVMVNDCMDEENRTDFTTGLTHFNDFSKTNSGKKFEKLDRSQREELIKIGMASEDEIDAAIRHFLNTSKRFTIQGFMLSEYMQTEIKPYSLIPGTYKGEVLIADLNKEKLDG